MRRISARRIVLTSCSALLTGVALSAGLSPASRRSLFPARRNGSLIATDGKVVGSALIGQPFDRARVLLEPALGDRAAAVQRRRVRRLEPRAR